MKKAVSFEFYLNLVVKTLIFSLDRKQQESNSFAIRVVAAIQLGLNKTIFPLIKQILSLSAQIHKCAYEVRESREEDHKVSQAEVNCEKVCDVQFH